MRSDPWYTRWSGRPHDDNDTLFHGNSSHLALLDKISKKFEFQIRVYGILAERGNSRLDLRYLLKFFESFYSIILAFKWNKRNRQSNSLLQFKFKSDFK